jgi:hypothetical protein
MLILAIVMLMVEPTRAHVDLPPDFATSTEAVQHEFDFLVFSDMLRGSLEEHVEQHQLATEGVLEIQCIDRNPAPTLGLELDHKDWVSAVHYHKNL